MKKVLFLVLRIGVALMGLGYIIYAMDWKDHVDDQGVSHPGVISTLEHANWGLLLVALLMTGLIYPIFCTRWWLLMRVRQIPCSYPKAFRLAMVGCFFNYCMPGTTGGDLVKAYYASKGSDRKADAVISVIVDRILGLLGLIIVAGVSGLFMLHEPAVRYITSVVWGSGILGVVCASVYFSGRLRKILHLDALINKLPGSELIGKIDVAAVAYRGHLGTLAICLGMSTLLHMILISATIVTAIALGVTQPVLLLLNVIPVLFLGAALPISYQGLGVMEVIGKQFLVAPELCSFNQLVGLLMLARLFQMFYSMFGSLFLLKGDIHLHPTIDEAEIAPAE